MVMIQHRPYGDVVVELLYEFGDDNNPYPESGDCTVVYQGIPSWAFKKDLKPLSTEAMKLYSPDGASTRGGACRDRPTESEYIEFFQSRLKRGNDETGTSKENQG